MAESPEAIVFVSRGLPAYTLSALYQAHIFNPHLPIHFISDRNPRVPFVIWHDIDKYSESWSEFDRAYTHLNSCELWITKIWFHRWFALHQWMIESELNYVVHLDTDVLIWIDVRNFGHNVPSGCLGVGHAIGGSFSGHCAFINGRDVLATLTTFCVDMFADPAKLRIISDFYLTKKRNREAGGICDMYAIGWSCGWGQSDKATIRQIELNTPTLWQVAFDQSFQDRRTAIDANFWASENGLKKVTWSEDGLPYFVTNDAREIRVATMHLQGENKYLMHRLMTQRSVAYYRRWLPRKLYQETTRRVYSTYGVFSTIIRRAIRRLTRSFWLRKSR